jgi:hypothetical protein
MCNNRSHELPRSSTTHSIGLIGELGFDTGPRSGRSLELSMLYDPNHNPHSNPRPIQMGEWSHDQCYKYV